MKKILIQFFPVTIFAIQSSLCYQEVRTYLGVNDPQYLLIVAFALSVIFLLSYYFNFLKPYAKFERFEDTKELFLNNMAEEFIETFRKEKIPLRLNIMLLERRWISFLEPGKFFGRKICFFKRHLASKWVSRNKDHSPDRAITLTINQGIAGQAVRMGKPLFNSPLENLSLHSYNLNKEQIQKVNEVMFIFSFPIREIDKKTKRISGKIIGVVNIDSTSSKALEFMSNPKLMESLCEKTQGVAENCSLVF